jgi:hypothetical protein
MFLRSNFGLGFDWKGLWLRAYGKFLVGFFVIGLFWFGVKLFLVSMGLSFVRRFLA